MSVALVNERLHRDGFSIRANNGQVLISPKERVTDEIINLVKTHKSDLLIYLQLRIPCQVQWQPDCAGPGAKTTQIFPERLGFTASPDQYATACKPCRAIMEERSRNQTFARENYLLWAVIRTQQLRTLNEEKP